MTAKGRSRNNWTLVLDRARTGVSPISFVQLAPERHATLCDSRRLDSDRSEAVAGWRVHPLWIAALHGARRFSGQAARWQALPCEENRRPRADLFVPPAACSGVVNEAFCVRRFWRHVRCIWQAAGLVVFSAASLTARLLSPSRSDRTNGLAFTYSAAA